MDGNASAPLDSYVETLTVLNDFAHVCLEELVEITRTFSDDSLIAACLTDKEFEKIRRHLSERINIDIERVSWLSRESNVPQPRRVQNPVNARCCCCALCCS